MRTLKFIVNGKTIKPDPNCDFSGLFPGKDQHIIAEFTFSPEWKNGVKVVGFWSILDKEYQPQVLKNGKSCVIPTEALELTAFKMQVLGKNNRNRLKSNKLTVCQSGGKR